jgi:hypothetical protein
MHFERLRTLLTGFCYILKIYFTKNEQGMLTNGIQRQISVTMATRMIVIVGSDTVGYKLKKEHGAALNNMCKISSDLNPEQCKSYYTHRMT